MEALIEDYVRYYSLEELENLKEEQRDKLRACSSINELFVYSVIYGLEDLAEYMYKHCGVSFELNDLLIKSGVSSDKILVQEDTPQVVPNYLNQRDRNRLRVFNRLLSLRKYSKLYTKDKKFIYTYNQKYLN